MSFHEVQFPTGISYGSSGGPGHSTVVVETDSGAEERISKWNGARRKYNAGYGVKSHDDLSELLKFAIARKGSAYGFRYWDPSDYTTASNHRNAPTSVDVNIGVGDGVTTQFQLIKYYSSGGVVRTRNLRKPVAGTVLAAFDGVTQGAGWSVNTTTGIITFTVAPALDKVITAGCEFDVPVRFGIEIDDMMAIQYDDFGSGSVPNISIVEIITGETTADEFFYGGASTFDPMAANITLTQVNGRVIAVNPTSGGLTIYLPPNADTRSGGPQLYIKNKNGANTVVVYDSTGVNSIVTIPVSTTVEFIFDGANWTAF